MEPVVITNPSDASQLFIWYCGTPRGGLPGKIYRSTAAVSDPFTWSAGVEVFSRSAELWENLGNRLDCILYESGTYYMYYSGKTAGGLSNIGLATSLDGITWTRQNGGNPILTPTAPDISVSQAAVLHEGSNWYMYYSHATATAQLPDIKLATSSDGISWTQPGTVAWAKGADGDYDQDIKEWQQIQKIGGKYVLITSCAKNSVWTLVMASSDTPEGPFTKLATPILSGTGVDADWDSDHVATGAMFWIGGKWYLFYQGSTVTPPYNDRWSMGGATIE
jgi:hypothetical protein